MDKKSNEVGKPVSKEVAVKPAAKKEVAVKVDAKKEVAVKAAPKKEVAVKPAAKKEVVAVAAKSKAAPAKIKAADSTVKASVAAGQPAKKPAQDSAAKKSASPKVPEVKKAAAAAGSDKTEKAEKSGGKAQPAKPVVKAPARKKQILFVGSEVIAFAGTGGLGEVLGSLPKAINESSKEFEASVIIPLYQSVSQETRDKFEFLFKLNVPLGWRNQYCGVFRYRYDGVTYYFVDNEYYFKRPNLYGYYDDGERFAFFSRAVNEIIPCLDIKPDILHCHDWQTALVPVYYKLFYQYRENNGGIKTVFTIHNIEYQGKYGKNIIEDVFGIPASEYLSLEHNGCINLVKGAIDYSDAVSTVSPTYAKELEDPFYAHGLDDVICKNAGKMRGILNGVDIDSYNPETNPALFAHYSALNPAQKAVNKAELQKMLSLPENPDVPLIAMISRLVSHKGLDLVRYSMNELLKMNVQVVVLGKGDPDYEGYFTHTQKMYDSKLSAVIAFNRDLSHKVYSAADIFLMPSKSEPCGLSQMMACRYGTVPVVRATGGLWDSIKDCGDGQTGNGFVFNGYDAGEMMHAIERAVGLYTDYKPKWKGLVNRCMTTDFSWGKSAAEYIAFYKELV